MTLAVLFFLSKQFVTPLFTTEQGRWFLTYAAVSVVVGYLVMMKIADVEM